MEPEVFEDYLLNEVIEAEAAGRAAADHDNRIGTHPEGLDKISKDDLKRKADTFVGMEYPQRQGLSAGFRRKDVRNPCRLCNGLAEDMHRAQMREGDLHPCLPTTFLPLS
jgi:hypothetical protein